MENMNRPITSKETEVVTKKLTLREKNQESDPFTGEFYPTLKVELISTLVKLKRRECVSHFKEAKIALIPKPDKDNNKRRLQAKWLPWWCSSKESICNAGDADLIPGSGISPGGGHGNLPQYSCLGNPMDRGAWQVTVHGGLKELDMTW